jgi:hypothetical protein
LDGDNKQAVGLECKAPWTDMLLAGQKTIECRSYPLPDELIGKAWPACFRLRKPCSLVNGLNVAYGIQDEKCGCWRLVGSKAWQPWARKYRQGVIWQE